MFFKSLFTLKITILISIVICLFLSTFYIKHLRKEVEQYKSLYNTSQYQLETCKSTNKELLEQISVQRQDYEAKVNSLLRKIKDLSSKTPVIQIPKDVPKESKITQEECLKMGVMLDDFENAIKTLDSH